MWQQEDGGGGEDARRQDLSRLTHTHAVLRQKEWTKKPAEEGGNWKKKIKKDTE
jgi:hypothetical protein